MKKKITEKKSKGEKDYKREKEPMKRFRKVGYSLNTCTPDGTTGNRTYLCTGKRGH